MSDTSNTIANTEELIEIPSYLSNDYGIALAAYDCGICQSNLQGCGSSEHGSCSSCEDGFEGETCSSGEDCTSCQSSCEHTCEGSCMVGCEVSSQCSCQSSSSCQSASTCMDYCQNTAETCGSCQSGCQGCEGGCQGCEAACEYAAQRPANAAWVTTIAANVQIKLTAAEWNAFTTAINAFRTYKGLGTISFTSITAGDHIKQEHFTQARSAINDMSPPSPVPDVSGIITAASLNGLMASLNSIQ